MEKLFKIFQKSFEEAGKKCSQESTKINSLIHGTLVVSKELHSRGKIGLTLVDISLFELSRLLVHVLFLSLNGLYKNAYDNLRYALESAIQSVYIESKYPECSLRTKIEILREIENSREYRAKNLIGKLNIDHKDILQKEYTRLSQIIHPSHRRLLNMLNMISKRYSWSTDGFITVVDCEELSKVYDSMTIVLDMVLFLYVSCSPKELKDSLQSNLNLASYCKKHNLILMLKIMKARQRVKK